MVTENVPASVHFALNTIQVSNTSHGNPELLFQRKGNAQFSCLQDVCQASFKPFLVRKTNCYQLGSSEKLSTNNTKGSHALSKLVYLFYPIYD